MRLRATVDRVLPVSGNEERLDEPGLRRAVYQGYYGWAGGRGTFFGAIETNKVVGFNVTPSTESEQDGSLVVRTVRSPMPLPDRFSSWNNQSRPRAISEYNADTLRKFEPEIVARARRVEDVARIIKTGIVSALAVAGVSFALSSSPASHREASLPDHGSRVLGPPDIMPANVGRLTLTDYINQEQVDA